MGRSPCCSNIGLHRGPWTTKEDALLVKYIQDHGEGQWRSLPKKAGLLRCGKSCRLRWMNYLRPDIKRGNITCDEDDLIIKMHALLGNRWSLIAGRLPGRTDNEIKNYWNTHLSRKLRSQGIDPNTHKILPEDTFPQIPKKRRNRRSTATRASYSNNKKNKYCSKILEEPEKTKIHNPKPIRLSSTIPFSEKMKNSPHDVFKSASKSLMYGGDRGLAGVKIAGAPWTSNNNSTGDKGLSFFIHGSPSDHDHDHVVNGSDLESQSHIPILNNCTLDKIYEEYLQLLETEEKDKAEVDSFAVSVSI